MNVSSILSASQSRIQSTATFFQSIQWKDVLQKVRWKSFILGALIFPMLLSGMWWISGDDDVQEITSEIVAVTKRDISTSIKALGKVTLANEQQLRFNQLGKVAVVHVEEGEEVERDQLIAELDKDDVEADIRQAELSVNDAWLRLKDLRNSSDEQVLSQQNSLRSIERQLEEAYGSVTATEKNVDYAIEQAKRNVAEAEAAYEQSIQNLADTINDTMNNVNDQLDEVYAILQGESVVRGASRFKSFEINLLYTNQTLKNETEWAYYDVVNALKDFEEQYPNILNIESQDVLETALKDAISVVQLLIELADTGYKFIVTVVPSISVTDANINTYKTNMHTILKNANTYLDTLRGEKATLTRPNENVAFQKLQKTREDLEILEYQKKNGITSADDLERNIEKINDDMRVQQAKLENTKSGLEVSIAQAQTSLEQKQVSLEKAKRAVEKYELRAPFDGIVRRIDFQVGDNLLADANESKYVVFENDDYLIITIQLDQVDIVHIKEGQKALVTLDALPGKTLEGTVDNIDTTAIEQSGVVSYEVEVAIDQTGDTILSGMTATVEIITDSRENVVAVPNLAVQTMGQRAFVILESGERQQVETGFTDGKYTEIMSGLEGGERIQSIQVQINTTSTNLDSGGGPPPMGMGMGMMRR